MPSEAQYLRHVTVDAESRSDRHPAADQATSLGTLHAVQFLRFVAATMVVVLHSYQTVVATSQGAAVSLFAHRAVPATSQGPGSELLDYLTSFGASGVHIFFVISGFIMVYTGFGRGESRLVFRPYILKRLIRIYPIYWVCTALYLAYGWAVGASNALGPVELLGSLLLVPGYASAIIGPGWTLAYEMYFYFLFGLFMIAGLRIGLIALSLFFVASILTPGLDGVPYQLRNAILLEFAAGAWVGLFYLKHREALLGWGAFALVAGLALFACGLLVGYERFPATLVWGIPSTLIVAGVVLLEAERRFPSFVARYPSLGGSSYLLYLSHLLVIYAVLASPLGPRSQSIPETLLICGALILTCCVLSVVFYRIVEKPMNALLRKWLLTKPGQAPIALPERAPAAPHVVPNRRGDA